MFNQGEMMSSNAPPKWWKVYQQGTVRGNEEAKVFRALARNPKFEWRSVSALATDSGLTKTRVEEILSAYVGLGVVVQKPTNPELWGYWEIVSPELAKSVTKTVSQTDQE